MVTKPPGKHLSDARLHALLAGELDPAQKAAVEAHLQACEQCRQRKEEVSRVQSLLSQVTPQEPDDLAWRRLQERVRVKLEESASEQEVNTIDIIRGRRWVSAGLVAAAVVALLVWFAPRRQPSRPEGQGLVAQKDAQVISSGNAPLNVQLVSGTQLHLENQSEVVASSPGADKTQIELKRGAVAVRMPQKAGSLRPVHVRTPAFSTVAYSRDFSVGYQSSSYFVHVREGYVEVEGPGFEGKQRVEKGERQVVHLKTPNKKSEKGTSQPDSGVAAPATDKIAPKKQFETVETVRDSSEGVTKVEVLSVPVVDPLGESWRAANQAYYGKRDFKEAIRLASKVAAAGKNRPEGPLAVRMLCEARMSLGQGAQAIKACEKLLELESNQEQIRLVHYTLATIYRDQLNDCESAIRHYNRATVFGRTLRLDDEVRFFRATCALEVGNLDLADADLSALESRKRAHRPEELKALRRKLSVLRTSTQDGTKRDD